VFKPKRWIETGTLFL